MNWSETRIMRVGSRGYVLVNGHTVIAQCAHSFQIWRLGASMVGAPEWVLTVFRGLI